MSEDKSEKSGGEVSSTSSQPRLFGVRTTAGREIDVALLIAQNAVDEEIPVYAIVVPPKIKSYVIVESTAAFHVANVIRGIRYAKNVVPGVLNYDDVERILKPEAVIETLKPGDIVEIVSGPFKGLKAQVVRVQAGRNEVVLNVLEVEYPLQITVPGDSVKPARRGE